jgi:hypothetical protein
METPKKVLSEDQLISNLVPDPANVPKVHMHIGMLGKSHREGYWRLYTTPQLNAFIEIHEDDIVHAEQLGSQGGVSQGTAAWVKDNANVVRTEVGPLQSQTDFLSGQIMKSHLASTIAANPALSTWWLTLSTLACVVVVSTVCSVDCKPTAGGEASVCLCLRR